MTEDLARRLERVEDRLGRLEERVEQRLAGLEERAAGPAAPLAGAAEAFWALEALKSRAQDVVLFTGAVTLPTGEHYEWQESRALEDLLDGDPTSSAAVFDALAHPIRVLILQHILRGVRTTAELGALHELGTSGQVYHHLRQLVAQGWLQLVARGQYQVPPQRVIPLLIVLAGARR